MRARCVRRARASAIGHAYSVFGSSSAVAAAGHRHTNGRVRRCERSRARSVIGERARGVCTMRNGRDARSRSRRRSAVAAEIFIQHEKPRSRECTCHASESDGRREARCYKCVLMHVLRRFVAGGRRAHVASICVMSHYGEVSLNRFEFYFLARLDSFFLLFTAYMIRYYLNQ